MAERILLVEHKLDGHYLYYTRLLVLAALGRGAQVALATRADLPQTDVGAFYLGDLFDRIRLIEVAPLDLRAVEDAADRWRAGRTVIADADLWLPQVARRRWRASGTLELLVLRASTQPHRIRGAQAVRTAAKRLLMLRAARAPRIRLSVLRSSIWRGRSAFSVTRDPITLSVSAADAEAVAADWDLDRDRTWFAVLGNITDRKNLPLVAAAVARIALDRPVGLLVGGKVEAGQIEACGPAIDALRRAGGLVLVDRMLSEEELDAAVRVVDCVVLAHSNEGPSGLMAKSAAAGTRVLAAGARSLRRDARVIPSLAAWTPLESEALERAMRRAAELPRPRPVVDVGSAAFTSSLLGRPADDRRVMWCSPSYGYGGDLLYFAPIFRGLHERFPSMIVPVDVDFPVQRYPDLPLRPVLRFVRTGRPGRSYGRGGLVLPTPGSLLRLVRLRPEVLLCIEFTPLACVGMILFRLLPGRRRILLLLESDPRFRGGSSSTVVRLVKRLLAGAADTVVANSELARRYAVSGLRIPERRVVRASYLTSDPTGGSPLQTPSEPLSVLFVNSFTRRKGADRLVRAFAALPEQVRARARLDLVGDGDLHAELVELAARLGVGDRTVFHGRLPHGVLGPLYTAAAIVVAPTSADYRSLAAIEAAAAGRPAIVSRADGAHVELAAAGALVVDGDRVEELTEALLTLLGDPAEYARRSDLAEGARGAHSVARVVDDLSRVIRDDDGGEQ